MIKFNGTRSDEVNLIVEHYPTRQLPERSYEVIEVPGRNGDIIIDNDNFKNYRQTYTVFIDAFSPEDTTFQLVTRKLAVWLLSEPGYHKLEDSYDPEFFRMAYYTGGSDFSNFFNVYGRGSLEFTCAPQRYFKKGDEPITFSGSIELYSPSSFPADPIFEGGEINAITINGKTLRFSGSPDYIDIQNHIATKNGVYIPTYSGNYDDMKLRQKHNTIEVSGTTSIRPRWWTL